MAQRPGKRGRTMGLVDMSAQPEAEKRWEYRRPEKAELVQDRPITLTEAPGQSVYVVEWVYNKRTVDFALTHRLEETAGEYEWIARYDCCHSNVHKHQYNRFQKGQVGEPRVIAEITDQATSWETIDSVYDDCYDDMFDNWHENYRRWNEDGRTYR